MKTMNFYRTVMILLAFFGMASFFTMPLYASGHSEKVVKETRTVGAFTGIKVGGAFEVHIKQTGTPGVVVEADEEVISYITTEVSGNVLTIGMKRTPTKTWDNIHTLNVYITVADLNFLSLSGAVEISTESPVTGNMLEMDVSGAVEADLNFQYKKITMDVSGASELKLNGQAEVLTIEASGASELNAYGMVVNDLSIFASGATDAKVNASGSLKISASGACDVRYRGEASVNAHTSGASSVEHDD